MTVDNTAMIPLTEIDANYEFNCRAGRISPIDVADLAKDIAANGMVQPVLVMKYDKPTNGKTYKLIGGFRRFTAHQVNQAATIWANILSAMDEGQARCMNLRENLQRKNLTTMEEANALKPLFLQGYGEEKIMAELNQTRGWVQVRMMILKMPEEVHAEVDAGVITQTEVRDLYTIYKKLGKERCLQATKDLKEAKQKGGSGSKTMAKAKKKITGDAKRMRSKGELLDLQAKFRTIFGPCTITRVLAWASGEIGDNDLEHTIREVCEKEGATFISLFD